MKSFIALILLAFAPVISATNQAASESSIKQLIEITQARQLMDSSLGQLDGLMQNSVKGMAGDRRLTPQQQTIITKMQQQMIELFKQELSWEKMENDFIEIYRQSLSEEEVQGMIEFYRTQAGQALIRKMPIVMRHSMEMIQNRMVEMMPRIQQIQQEAIAEMKASGPESEKH